MNFKSNTNNSNIRRGQQIELMCSKTKKIVISAMYTIHKSGPDTLYYSFALYKKDHEGWKYFSKLNSNDPFNIQDQNEIVKLWQFFQETSALETLPVNTIVTTDNAETAKEAVKALTTKKEYFEVLNEIGLEVLNANVSLRNLYGLKRELEENLYQGERDYWHNKLRKYPWVLSQLFVAPYVLLGDELYVGGMRYSGKGAVKPDFHMINENTKNIALIEIKSPATSLIEKYRNEGEFRASTDLSGALSQVLKQRDTLYKEYRNVQLDDEEKPVFKANNIRCILIIGITPQKAKEKDAFDNFRNELKSIDIITFDELINKISHQIEIIEFNYEE